MDKERFLDVNGFNVEYHMPLEKRLKKYGKGGQRDTSRATTPLTEKLAAQSQEWSADVRHKQVISAIAAGVVVVLIIAICVYVTLIAG